MAVTMVEKAEGVGDVCREIYRVTVDPEVDISQAFAAKLRLQNYHYLRSNQVMACLAGIAQRVKADLEKLHENGEAATAEAIARRLELVNQ